MNQPWLDNKAWRKNLISSGAKYGHWAVGAFALFWNLVTLPIFWNIEEIVARIPDEPVILVAFLFPAIGLGLLWSSWVMFQRWRKFGPTPLVLDPFPGSLGGHVGGWIDTRIPYDAVQHYAVTLACLKSSVSGSGKDRKRSESVKWQTDGICHTERSGNGTLLRFRFDIPEDLPASDMLRTGTYYLWRAHIAAELDGPDFNRGFEIPVFPTAERSTIEEGTESHAATQDLAMEGVESIAEITAIPGGIEAWFPAFQRPAQGFATIVFGMFFAGAGLGVGFADDGGVVIPVVFTLVGSLILLYGIWYLGKALMVGVTEEQVRCRRFLFGYPLATKTLPRADFKCFEIHEGATMSSGNKTTVFYQLHALGRDGQKLVVAERLTSRAEVELLKETFETYLSL
jgi:hypothetical protein